MHDCFGRERSGASSLSCRHLLTVPLLSLLLLLLLWWCWWQQLLSFSTMQGVVR